MYFCFLKAHFEMFLVCGNRLFQLTEDMCQKGDRKFIDFPNNIRMRKTFESDLQFLMGFETNIDGYKK